MRTSERTNYQPKGRWEVSHLLWDGKEEMDNKMMGNLYIWWKDSSGDWIFIGYLKLKTIWEVLAQISFCPNWYKVKYQAAPSLTTQQWFQSTSCYRYFWWLQHWMSLVHKVELFKIPLWQQINLEWQRLSARCKSGEDKGVWNLHRAMRAFYALKSASSSMWLSIC